MHGGVQHHVRRRQDAELAVAVERQALRREGPGGDRSARGERHDGVMDVQHGVAPVVSPWVDLVPPAPDASLIFFSSHCPPPAPSVAPLYAVLLLPPPPPDVQ